MALLEWVEFLPEVVALATYPDRLPAPRPPPDSVTVDVFTAALTPPITPPVYPHVIRAPARLPHTFVALPPQPERTAPLAATTYPDAVRRPSLPVALHQATVPPPQPEGTLPLDWQPSYPPAVRRPSLGPWGQQALAFAPKPEASAPGWGATFPDAFPPRRGPAVGLVVLPPAPEEPAPDVWLPVYPARVARPFLGPALQQAWVMGQPEGTPYAVSPCPQLDAIVVALPDLGGAVAPMPALGGNEVGVPDLGGDVVPLPDLPATLKC